MKRGDRRTFYPKSKRQAVESRQESNRTLMGRVWDICGGLSSENKKIISMLATLQTISTKDNEAGFFLNIGRTDPEIFRANTILQNVDSDEEKIAFAIALLEGIQEEI